jgi:hypothetical protein
MQVVYIGKDDRLIKGKTYKVYKYNAENKEISLLINSIEHVLTLDVDVVLSYEPHVVHSLHPIESNECYLSLMDVISSVNGDLNNTCIKGSVESLIKTYGHKGLRFTLEKSDE